MVELVPSHTTDATVTDSYYRDCPFQDWGKSYKNMVYRTARIHLDLGKVREITWNQGVCAGYRMMEDGRKTWITTVIAVR